MNLVVGQPLVNILRGALSVLAAIVQHPAGQNVHGGEAGFAALKPAIDAYPEFLQSLVRRLTSPDHSLCLAALQLINAMIRDAMDHNSDRDWVLLVQRLQALGVVRAVHALMLDPAVSDLASTLLEFQALQKLQYRKWRDESVNLDMSEHSRMLTSVWAAANPGRSAITTEEIIRFDRNPRMPEKWRSIGFETEDPGWEFEETGTLGMLDLNGLASEEDEGFARLVEEQLSKPAANRCPIVRASLAVTAILYDHFEIDDADGSVDEGIGGLDARNNLDKLFRPLLLQWNQLHKAGVRAFLRLWQTTGATSDDFAKIDELVRILVEEVVGLAPRMRDVSEVETALAAYDLRCLRELQMQLLEVTHEESWGRHLRAVKEELRHEALQFIKEQRIRVLLAGAWFPNPSPGGGDAGKPASWRFVRLSYNRRSLRYDDFDARAPVGKEPALEALDYKLDLGVVSSVVSSVTAPSDSAPPSPSSSTETLKLKSASARRASSKRARTDIVIHGYTGSDAAARKAGAPPRGDGVDGGRTETALLTLRPATQSEAAEWLDGLLLLLNQTPITAETNRLIDFIARYGLRIRLLNVRFEEPAAAGNGKGVVVPSREGLDEDYYYDMAGG